MKNKNIKRNRKNELVELKTYKKIPSVCAPHLQPVKLAEQSPQNEFTLD